MNAVVEEDFQRSLELLPEVFNLLLHRDGNEIQDDTFLEKLMSWFEKSLEDRTKFCFILKSRAWQYLRQSTRDEEACSSAVCLRFKLLSCLAKGVHRFIKDDDILEMISPVNGMVGVSDSLKIKDEEVHSDDCCSNKKGKELSEDLINIGKSLLTQAFSADHQSNSNIRYWGILTATELLDIPAWIPALQKQDMTVTACNLLKDKSMFVVSMAERFLAKVLLMTTVKNFAEDKQDPGDTYWDDGKQTFLTSGDFDEGDLKTETSLSSAVRTSSKRRGMKRKADECVTDGGEDGHFQPSEEAKAEEQQRQINNALLKWGTTIFENIKVEMDGITGGELDSCGDLKYADLKLLGVFNCLLRMSEAASTLWFEYQKITKTFCSLLRKCSSLSLQETNAVVELICLQMKNLKRLPKLRSEKCHQLIGSAFETVTFILKDQHRWQSAFKMIPPLFGLCSRIHFKECSQLDVKHQAVHLTRSLLSSLRDPSDASIHFSFVFKKSSKQELLSMRRSVMTLIEDLIREDSWVIVEELTSEALDAVEFVLGIISSQYRVCSKPLVDKLAMQTLDTLDALIKKVPVEQKDHLPAIMHQKLLLVHSVDCNNTVLTKALNVLKTFLSLSGDGDMESDRLMEEADEVLKKHLMSMHWEGRDSAVSFIGTLMELENGVVNKWLSGTNLHQEVWNKLDDDEDYVRQAALKALGILMADQNLLRDLMKKKNLKEVDIARRVAMVVTEDSGGFARRAAMGLFHKWIKVDGWIRKCVLSPEEWQTYKMSTSVKHCSTIAEVVFLAVTIATRDFDWEVKLSAMEFWCEFYTAVVPGLTMTSDLRTDAGRDDGISGAKDPQVSTKSVAEVDAFTSVMSHKETLTRLCGAPDYIATLHLETQRSGDTDTTVKQSFGKSRNHSCHGNQKDTYLKDNTSWTKVLQNHPFLNLLVEKLSDEDIAVRKRACEILKGLRKHIAKLCICDSGGDHSNDHGVYGCDVPGCEIAELQTVLTRLEGCNIDYVYKGCMEGSLQKMAPLLEEVISAAVKESTANHDMDCY